MIVPLGRSGDIAAAPSDVISGWYLTSCDSGDIIMPLSLVAIEAAKGCDSPTSSPTAAASAARRIVSRATGG